MCKCKQETSCITTTLVNGICVSVADAAESAQSAQQSATTAAQKAAEAKVYRDDAQEILNSINNGGGSNIINDASQSATTTYSSQKIENMYANIQNGTNQINDMVSSSSSTYSSAKIDNICASIQNGGSANIINDASSSVATTYSSSKIDLLQANMNALIANIETVLHSDDVNLDSIVEIVDYVKANRELIDSITITKLNVSDVINTLTSMEADKALSAAQGKVLRDMIDVINASMHSHANKSVLDSLTESAGALLYNGLPISGSGSSSAKAITYLSKSGCNSQAMLYGGKLFTTSGNNAGYSNPTTGRGLNGQNPFFGCDNFKAVSIPSNSAIVKSGGFVTSFAYALLANGELYTWGYNYCGQCGLGHANPVALPTLSATDVVDVYDHPSNGEHSVTDNRLFIKKLDGYIYGTGYNGNGQLGIGNTINQLSWTQILSLGTNVKKLFNLGAGSGATVALTAGGKIMMAGYNGYGQLGNGTTNNLTTFTDVTNAWAGVSSGVLDIKASGGFRYYDSADSIRGTLLLLITLPDNINIVKSCGNNTWGQLGDGTMVNKSIPVSVLNSENIVDIALFGGGPATCQMLKSDGALYAWGYNYYGQVGKGATADGESTPVLVLSNVKKLLSDGMTSHVSGYVTQSFVVKNDGTLWTCGYNGDGECGIGNTTANITTYTKVLIPADENISDIGHFTTNGGGRITLVKTQKNNLYAWGYSTQNGVTASSTINCLAPVNVQLPIFNQ